MDEIKAIHDVYCSLITMDGRNPKGLLLFALAGLAVAVAGGGVAGTRSRGGALAGAIPAAFFLAALWC